MPSAVALRKTALEILEERILPDLLASGAPRLALAQLPLRLPKGVSVRPMEQPPLRDTEATHIYPEGQKWEAVQMHAIRFPALYCVVEGEADFPMGVTVAMLRQAGTSDRAPSARGGYLITLPAISYFLVPPGVPQSTGSSLWHRAEPHTGRTRLFIIRVLPIGALCHISTLQDAVYQVQYSLLVKDEQLSLATKILMRELKTAADTRITQAQLLTLMLRLRREMKARIPAITDGLYSRFPESKPVGWTSSSPGHAVIERAHQYIQLHLHEPLAPATIAEQVRLTPAQLNRLFRTHTGTSTMGYVTRLRMETAQLLLTTSTLSVAEICGLVGFRQVPHFSRTFHRHTGSAPLKFRQQQSGS